MRAIDNYKEGEIIIITYVYNQPKFGIVSTWKKYESQKNKCSTGNYATSVPVLMANKVIEAYHISYVKKFTPPVPETPEPKKSTPPAEPFDLIQLD